MKLLKNIGARSFILVTSDYHSARLDIYAPLAEKNGMKMYVYPSQDSDVNLEGWWKDRTSAKIVFMELKRRFGIDFLTDNQAVCTVCLVSLVRLVVFIKAS